MYQEGSEVGIPRKRIFPMEERMGICCAYPGCHVGSFRRAAVVLEGLEDAPTPVSVFRVSCRLPQVVEALHRLWAQSVDRIAGHQR